MDMQFKQNKGTAKRNIPSRHKHCWGVHRGIENTEYKSFKNPFELNYLVYIYLNALVINIGNGMGEYIYVVVQFPVVPEETHQICFKVYKYIVYFVLFVSFYDINSDD